MDIYGTILSSSDYENAMPFRNGFEEFVKRCHDAEIDIVTASDSEINMLRIDLQEACRKSGVLDMNIFDSFYYLNTYPKQFSQLIEDYGIKPEELFVIGDNYESDLREAEEVGCQVLIVPKYDLVGDRFDFSSIQIK